MGWLDKIEKEAAKKPKIAYIVDHHVNYSKPKTSKMNKSTITLILITAGSIFSIAMFVMLFSYHYDKYNQYQQERIEQAKDSIINYPLQKSGRVYDQKKYSSFNINVDKLVDSLITTDAEISYKEHFDAFDVRKITINLQYEKNIIRIEYGFGEKFKRPEQWKMHLIDLNGQKKDLMRYFYDEANVSNQTIARLKSICNICEIE